MLKASDHWGRNVYTSSRVTMLTRKVSVSSSPILVVDALGFAAKIISAGEDDLLLLGKTLEQQYHRFKARVPHRFMIVTPRHVWGTKDFRIFRLNDMFILYSDRGGSENSFRILVASSFLYQAMLKEKFVPRGGLGVGALLKRSDLLVGAGFVDAYTASERREESTRHICAIQLSPEFMRSIPNTERAYRLLCFYKNKFFLHPWGLTDPEIGEFSADRVLECLRQGGANQEKLAATTDFLRDFQDYDEALASAPPGTYKTDGSKKDQNL